MSLTLPTICHTYPELSALYESTVKTLSEQALYARIVNAAFSEETLRNKGAILSEEGCSFLVRIKKAHPARLFVLSLDSMKKVGSGKFSTVYSVEDIVSHQFFAFKILTPEYKRRSLREIRKAKTLLKEINPKAEAPGIQQAPLAIIGISRKSKALLERVGSLEILYESDLFTRIDSLYNHYNLETNTRLEILATCTQILQGVVLLHQAKISHGDIKPDNILLKGKGAFLADFAGAKKAAELSKKPSTSPITNRYNLEWDVILEDNAVDEENWEKVHEIKTKRDVFQVGVTIAMLLTCAWPFPPIDAKDQETYLNVSSNFYSRYLNRDWPATLSYDLKKLLDQMLHQNLKTRLSAQEALNSWKKIWPK